MSDTVERKIIATTEKGIQRQWGRGLFYRDDGRKSTLVPKHVIIVSAVSFGAAALILLFQGTPEQKRNRTSTISAPSSMRIDSSQVNIPEAISSHASTKLSVVGSKQRNNKSDLVQSKTKSSFSGPQLIKRPQMNQIPTGSIIKARLLGGASDGPVRAETIESLHIAGEQLIPQGTVFLGQGQSNENRLSIRFTQMIFKDGAIETIDAIACDEADQTPGLKSSFLGSKALKLAAGVGLNFVGGMADAFQNSNDSSVNSRSLKLRKATINGAGTVALDQSREILSDTQNKTPSMEIPSDAHFYILFQKD